MCCDLIAGSTVDIIEHILVKLIAFPINLYDTAIVDCIYEFCIKWSMYWRNQSQFQRVKPSKIITNWHGGLRLLWRTMQTKRDQSESDIPIASKSIQNAAQEKLIQLVASKDGLEMYQLSE